MAVEGGKRGSHSTRLGQKGQSSNRPRAGRKEHIALEVGTVLWQLQMSGAVSSYKPQEGCSSCCLSGY